MLSSRLSERVPFGTGQSVIKIIKLIEARKPYLVENPKVFLALKIYLDYVKEVLNDPNLLEQSNCKIDDHKLFVFLKEYGYFLRLRKSVLLNSKVEVRIKYFHDNFDAFQTLKFIHRLSDKLYPKIPLQ